MEKLINSLKKLGLNRYEALTYIGINKIISGTADEIAQISQLPRSRIYDILNELEKKGFVEVKRKRPIQYRVIEPKTIIKKRKNEIIQELDECEEELQKLYDNQISEVRAPVWLIHSNEDIIKKEMEVIKKAKKSITVRLGFLLENEGEEMLKAFKKLPKNVEIKILANEKCYCSNEKIEIVKLFKNSNLDNLKIVKADLPMIKLLIRDGEEVFGTFVDFSEENNSIIPHTAVGVCNQYENICSNLNDYFLKQFNMLNNSHFTHN
ncbi:TrmB family transcriptional regulator [Methanobrevibacter sp.]|uniref:TrmB family transcriptional regulator n=1 Tax=Methanobrevibacter sp. TaxID=66852 RepID=UPI00388D72B0